MVRGLPATQESGYFWIFNNELTDLPEYLAKSRNFNMAVQKKGDTVIFLHNVEVGSSDQSYGINVAQLAGIPRSVIKRARLPPGGNSC